MRFELVRERLQALPRELPARAGDPDADSGRLAGSPALVAAPARGRPAAVLVLLFPDDRGQARVLLTARVPDLSAHAGEVSFPGGSAEPSDADPMATALREAAEEIGLDPAACGLQVTGPLEVSAPASRGSASRRSSAWRSGARTATPTPPRSPASSRRRSRPSCPTPPSSSRSRSSASA